MSDPVDPEPHVVTVRALPDIRGVVYFAVCHTCGWRGANHPGGGGEGLFGPHITSASEAKARAIADGNQHIAPSAPAPATVTITHD